jgi:sensor histidine kinase regulating citrate/malate metabolism
MKTFAERLRKASIGLKLSLTFVSVIALCSLPMSLLTINYLSNKLKQHVMNTIEESVQSQKDELIELILMENYWRAFNKIEALSQILGVKEVVLVDANSRIIASSKPEEKVVDGKGKIEISLRKEGENTVLMVKDNGHGIPKKHIKKVFDPFFSTKRDSTGLGLSTVVRYVQMLEGKLSVFSEEGKGSTFLVEVKA